jgi:hypothetical protein
LDTRKSTQAHITLLGNNPINWSSKLQKTVALSSTEAEYMALKSATQEAIYISNMLKWLNNNITSLKGVKIDPIVLIDNLSAEQLSENSTHHERTKHIDIAYHFTRECVDNGSIRVIHIPDKLQLADPLTKGVLRAKFEWFKTNIGFKSL